MDIEMIIENPQEGKAFVPVVEEGITWTTGRTGTPGQLDFTVIKDNIINFQEGNRVQLKIDGTHMKEALTKQYARVGTRTDL